MSLADLILTPFTDYAFMRRALIACLALSLTAGPIGTLLLLRRMSLVGDSLSHALLPGVALAYLIAGLSLPALGLGALGAGLIVVVLSGLIARITNLREDASFAGFYLIALALGVAIISAQGTPVDLLHILFGDPLAIDDPTLGVIALAVSVSLVALAFLWRALVVDSVDPAYLAALGGRGGLWHALFMALMVINLIAAFLALGTLMAIGLLMLPAATARLWSRDVGHMALLASAIAGGSSLLGLILSYHWDLPTGPAIVLAAGVVHVMSLVFASQGGILAAWPQRRHRAG